MFSKIVLLFKLINKPNYNQNNNTVFYRNTEYKQYINSPYDHSNKGYISKRLIIGKN